MLSRLKGMAQYLSYSVQFILVAQSCATVCDPHRPQHTKPSCLSPTPGIYSNSSPLSQWCYPTPTISSSVVPFSSRLQSFPASGSLPMSQLFTSGGQTVGISASTSVLPMSTQNWSPLGWTGWISLQSNGLPRVFSNTTVQKHPFFSTQLSSQSNSHIHTWPLPSAVILETKKIKSLSASFVSPPIYHEVMGPNAMVLVFWMFSFKPTFSLSSFIFIKRLFSSSLLSDIGWCHLHI